ncbi:hypothetical protein QN239_33325 [Mycolicibacterium sp. Y3]
MTDIEVLLNNFQVLAVRAGSSLLGIWAVYYFFRNLFGEAGRNPVKIVVSIICIAGAAAAFTLIPRAISTGSNTGEQVGGGGGYSMPAPVGLQGQSADPISAPEAA